MYVAGRIDLSFLYVRVTPCSHQSGFFCGARCIAVKMALETTLAATVARNSNCTKKDPFTRRAIRGAIRVDHTRQMTRLKIRSCRWLQLCYAQ